ncbi:permease [Litoreibacter arenae]|uniref:Transporter n=1 Tax=Litoreibacter arenae DSM 19593 TaxID=1123360 RepID=S9RTC2_9RHOB|nr:permease [Litoreibacter arenae]EPX77189.1 Transporter [Litoreibacter arenae DSM 19593]
MADLTQTSTPAPWSKLPKVWLASAVILALVLLFDRTEALPILIGTLQSLGHTAIFIIFAVLAIGYLKATGAEAVVAEAFKGRETRMIFLAAALGGLAPFCSCEVIPFIAALLVAGVPLSAVMAFWLASPLMDPAMFLITSGTLGFDFALAKTLSAIGLGLFGGFATMMLARSALFADPLRGVTQGGCGCGSPFKGTPNWRFWQEPKRVAVFKTAAFDNLAFLAKWLFLAYLLEHIMLRYVPADLVSSVLGGAGIGPIILGALVGAPAYLNGYAAVPLVDALLAQGMSNGAAMSFMLAGGVSCIPAAVAVWALVKPRVFFAYLAFAFVGSVIAGTIWNLIA